MEGSPERLLPQARSDPPTIGTQFQTALQAIKTGMLPDPFDHNDIPGDQLLIARGEDAELDNINDEINNNLTNELTKDVVEAVIGWGAYTLVDNLDLRKNHALPFDGRTLHTAVASTLLTLDIGGAKADDRWFDRFADEAPVLPARDPPKLPTHAPALREPLMEEQQRQIDARARETLYGETLEAYRTDEAVMAQIKASVKDGIFADLNAQAIENADEWQAVYKHEFVEAMHDAFEQYPGIHPGKGKGKAVPRHHFTGCLRRATTHSGGGPGQVAARITNIHNEIQDSLAAEEPFWKQGPLHNAIATTVRAAAQKEAKDLATQDITNMRQAATNETSNV
ncbi:hypothetical protein EDB89DRAFT_1916471 [Lactarius sanguifluus]|nr:hypothetical protein EDB89DRAFT_1916471 [Lactarius sanguifluus]